MTVLSIFSLKSKAELGHVSRFSKQHISTEKKNSIKKLLSELSVY